LKYLDDGNREEDVPIDELRQSESKIEKFDVNTKTRRMDTLPRPLQGLVDDDYDTRNSMTPRILIHDNNNTDEAIVLNGAENKLAAGRGIKAIRYLKQ